MPLETGCVFDVYRSRSSSSFSSLPSSAADPDHIVLTMPALSPTMEKGNIAQWKVKVGDKVNVGDVMAEVSTRHTRKAEAEERQCQ